MFFPWWGDVEVVEDGSLGGGEAVESEAVRGVGRAEALEGGEDVAAGGAGCAAGAMGCVGAPAAGVVGCGAAPGTGAADGV